MNIRRAVALACAGLTLAVLGGCGLPVDNTPQAIPTNQIPKALSETISSNFFTPPHGTAPTLIYLVGPDETLVGVPRLVKPPLTAQKALYELEAGPSPSESDKGVQTSIPDGAELVADGVSLGVLTVLLDTTFGSLRPGEATYEFGQIVCTVTALSGIHGVLFKYDGNTIRPLIGNGSISTSYVVGRSDYHDLLAS